MENKWKYAHQQRPQQHRPNTKRLLSVGTCSLEKARNDIDHFHITHAFDTQLIGILMVIQISQRWAEIETK